MTALVVPGVSVEPGSIVPPPPSPSGILGQWRRRPLTGRARRADVDAEIATVLGPGTLSSMPELADALATRVRRWSRPDDGAEDRDAAAEGPGRRTRGARPLGRTLGRQSRCASTRCSAPTAAACAPLTSPSTWFSVSSRRCTADPGPARSRRDLFQVINRGSTIPRRAGRGTAGRRADRSAGRRRLHHPAVLPGRRVLTPTTRLHCG